MLTVATDCMFSSLDEEGLEINIWKARVSKEPQEFAATPSSGETMKPDGSIGMLEESSPFIAMFMAGIPIGA